MSSFPCPSQDSAVSVYFPGVLPSPISQILVESLISQWPPTPQPCFTSSFLFSTVLPSLYFDMFVSVGISTVLGGRHRSAILNPSRLFLGKLSAQFSCVCCFWCIVSCPSVSPQLDWKPARATGLYPLYPAASRGHRPKCEAFQTVWKADCLQSPPFSLSTLTFQSLFPCPLCLHLSPRNV